MQCQGICSILIADIIPAIRPSSSKMTNFWIMWQEQNALLTDLWPLPDIEINYITRPFFWKGPFTYMKTLSEEALLHTRLPSLTRPFYTQEGPLWPGPLRYKKALSQKGLLHTRKASSLMRHFYLQESLFAKALLDTRRPFLKKPFHIQEGPPLTRMTSNNLLLHKGLSKKPFTNMNALSHRPVCNKKVLSEIGPFT